MLHAKLGLIEILKKILASLGISRSAEGSADAAELYKPYAESHVNFIYNLLFCDDLTLFKNENTTRGDALWRTLVAEKPDTVALRKIAEDEANEGRVRALAYNRLRAAGETVPPKKLLGVIVEVPLEHGLDVLAVFSEGGSRTSTSRGEWPSSRDTGIRWKAWRRN